MIEVYVVDDHQIVIDGIKDMLSDHEEIEVVGQAHDGASFIKSLEEKQPDVVLLDLSMPGMDGMDVAKYVKKHYPQVAVLVISMHKSGTYAEELMKTGVEGYILKNTDKSSLVNTILKVADGSTVYDTELIAEIVANRRKDHFSDPEAKRKEIDDYGLSDREVQVIRLMCKDFSTSEMADELALSEHTIKTHRKNLLKKIGARSVAGAVRFAFEHGLVDDSDGRSE